VVVKVDHHTRVVRFEDNGAELAFEVDQLEASQSNTRKGLDPRPSEALHAPRYVCARPPLVSALPARPHFSGLCARRQLGTRVSGLVLVPRRALC
jgi:hypothetical protein